MRTPADAERSIENSMPWLDAEGTYRMTCRMFEQLTEEAQIAFIEAQPILQEIAGYDPPGKP